MAKVIWAMHLHEDGRKVDITMIDKTSFTVDVTEIQRLSEGADADSNRVTQASQSEKVKAF